MIDESSRYLDQSESTKKYSLSWNHFNINKFERPKEENFQTICEVIKKMVEKSPQLITARDHNLGDLYTNQGKLAETEKMYQRALKGYEKALGPEHTFTLDIVNNLGSLYAD